MSQMINTGRDLELEVAQTYRQMGAWKVEHNVEMAGNQIDVYAELATPGYHLHRIAIEVKNWRRPVGIKTVNKFGQISKLLRDERLIDEGIVVSAVGFSRQARKAAHTYGIRLLDLADLEAMLTQSEEIERTRPVLQPIVAPAVLPPTPYLAHPYALQENFTGRIRERKMLTAWFANGRRPVLTLSAMGGMGKSALVWVWLQRDVLEQPLPGLTDDPPHAESLRMPEAKRPEGILWWSFYQSEASFIIFLDHALGYFGRGSLDPAAMPSTHDKVRKLLSLLEEHCFLVVLDGFERELRAYASLSAVYHGDQVALDVQGDFRACTDVHAANFLRWAAALPLKSRLLLTSRFPPLELDDLAGSQRKDLTALDPADAVAFFYAQGVEGTRKEIQAVCKTSGYHPLTLRLLTGMIAKDPNRPGDIAAMAGYNLIEDLVPRERHVLALAYDAMGQPLQELLSRLSAFRSPVEYKVAAMLSPFGSKRQLGLAFSELAQRGLIFFDKETWRYDLHPIVRAYAYDRLSDKEAIHEQLRDYFAAVPMPDLDLIARIEDLSPLIELYHHTVCAGQYDQAAELFHDYLADPLYYRFGAYRTEIDLLRALLSDDPKLSAFQPVAEEPDSDRSRLPRLTDPGAQAWVLNALASSYICSGQPGRAMPLLRTHDVLQTELGDTISLTVGLENLARVQFELGELKLAEETLRRSIEWGRENEELDIEASGRTDLGRLLAYRGAFDEAGLELDAALDRQIKAGKTQSQLLSWIHRAQLALLMGIPEVALDAANTALEMAEEASTPSQFAYSARSLVWSRWLLGAAHLEQGDLVEAETQLNQALTDCRYIDLVELEPDILLSLARWHHAGGDREQAQECAEEALSIASRSEYRLKEAELHCFLAHVRLDAGQAAEAQRHAEVARERAWCDGPPHCYKPALDEAESLLELIRS
jgi:tetratricopeptide (TPR) repeat protein